jgi:hypothetical protein
MWRPPISSLCTEIKNCEYIKPNSAGQELKHVLYKVKRWDYIVVQETIIILNALQYQRGFWDIHLLQIY